eukprot:TRINITY_DN13891_c0_g1_i1.p1 TRINITY_DN13891_c0_g1~~TRINITY_DN13891_c0_g1_i1.p1  ORF type:complete len:390 (+),score=124.81 TRINITY_DN13891_c0_g1_i1:93-1172(+)
MSASWGWGSAEDGEGPESQGDQLMARKQGKQAARRQPAAAAWSAAGAAPAAPPQPPAPGLLQPTGWGWSAQGARPQQSQRQSPDPVPRTQEETRAAAARRREECLKRFDIDRDKQRQALYSAWPEDTVFLKQQIALLQQELSERDRQLLDAQQDARALAHELEQEKQRHNAEVRRIKVENLSQLIRTFQTDGLRGLEGLARMQQAGQFQEEREKERQRVHELETGVMHDMEAMRREYEDKLRDMKEEYQVRLNWLAHKQAMLEAAHSTAGLPPHPGAALRADPRADGGCAARSGGPPTPRGPRARSQPSTATPAAGGARRAPYQRQRAPEHASPGSRTSGSVKEHRDALARGFYARMGY